MKSQKIPNERFNIEPDWQWSQLLPWVGFNWRTFTLIQIEGEIDHAEGAAILRLGLLGLTLHIRFCYDMARHKLMFVEAFRLAMKDKFGPDVKIEDPFGSLKDLDERDRKEVDSGDGEG